MDKIKLHPTFPHFRSQMCCKPFTSTITRVLHTVVLTVSHCPTSSFSFWAGSTFWARPSPSLEYAFVLVSRSTILNRSICCEKQKLINCSQKHDIFFYCVPKLSTFLCILFQNKNLLVLFGFITYIILNNWLFTHLQKGLERFHLLKTLLKYFIQKQNLI